MELRRYPRVACAAAGSLWTGAAWRGKGPVKVQLVDLSETGAAVKVPPGTRLTVGQHLRLSWRIPVGAGIPGSGKFCSIGASVRRVPSDGASDSAGLAFDRRIPEQLAIAAEWPRKVFAILMAGLLGGLIVWIKVDNARWFWHGPVLHAYSLVASGYVLLRLILSLFYKLPRDHG